MHKLDDFKVYFSFGFAAIIVPVAYILRDLLQSQGIIQPIGMAVFSVVTTILFVFGLTIARWFAGKLVQKRWMRKWILGVAYVEGYWLLKTDAQGKITSTLDTTGIVFMSYKNDCREFKIETTRYDGNRRYVTQSEVGYIRTTGSTIRYLNFFNLTYPDPNGVNGFSSGRFSYGDHFASCPQYFDAVIAIQDGDYSGAQYAERIQDDIVEKYYKKHGSDWMKTYILERSDPDFFAEVEESIEAHHKSEKAKKSRVVTAPVSNGATKKNSPVTSSNS